MAREKTKLKKKERKNISAGVAHINSSFNKRDYLNCSRSVPGISKKHTQPKLFRRIKIGAHIEILNF